MKGQYHGRHFELPTPNMKARDEATTIQAIQGQASSSAGTRHVVRLACVMVVPNDSAEIYRSSLLHDSQISRRAWDAIAEFDAIIITIQASR
jgi:hypothetical protein